MDCQVNLVEPYPNRGLCGSSKALGASRMYFAKAKFNIFEELEEGDICFYDGSHCVKTGSDVACFFFSMSYQRLHQAS